MPVDGPVSLHADHTVNYRQVRGHVLGHLGESQVYCLAAFVNLPLLLNPRQRANQYVLQAQGHHHVVMGLHRADRNNIRL